MTSCAWLQSVLEFKHELDRDALIITLIQRLPRAELRAAILAAIAKTLADHNIKDASNDLATRIASRATDAVAETLGVT